MRQSGLSHTSVNRFSGKKVNIPLAHHHFQHIPKEFWPDPYKKEKNPPPSPWEKEECYFPPRPVPVPPRFKFPYLDPPLSEQSVCDHYVAWSTKLSKQFVTLVNHVEKKVSFTNNFDNSSHGPRGIEKKKRNILRRLRHHRFTKAVIETLTFSGYYDACKAYVALTREEAWIYVTKLVGDFIDQQNKARKRRNAPPLRLYLWTIEIQDGHRQTADSKIDPRNFPDVHILFLDTRWVIKKEVAQRLWPYGNVHFQSAWSGNAAEYITKYTTKMNGNDFFHAMVKGRRLRTFALSEKLSYAPLPNKKTDWKFLNAAPLLGTIESKPSFIKQGFSITTDGTLHYLPP